MTWSTRHSVRNAGLPGQRMTLLAALTEDLVRDPRVLGAYVAGSLASGREDLYSDIDLRIVVGPEHFDAFVAQKRVRRKLGACAVL